MSTRITTLMGNGQRLDGGAMFGNAPRPVWEKWIAPDELGRIPLACRSLLIEHEGQRILVETGIGAFFETKLAERYGVEDAGKHKLLESLAQHRLSHEDIDWVILTHLHFDHAGGLLSAYKAGEGPILLFPKAKFLVSQEAWARAETPHSRDRASFIPDLTKLLKSSGRLQLVSRASHPELFPDRLSFFMSNGHTPGLLLPIFKGSHQTVVFCGDLIPGKPWVHLPITMGYDRYPEMLIDEKAHLYERAVPEKWILVFTHDSQVASARVRQGEKSRFETYDEQNQLNQYEL